MLEKFLGLKIKGRCFAEETELKFFPSDKQRVSMVFGRNGSGKSTVSRTFARLATDGTKYDGMEIVAVLDRDHPEAPSTLLTPSSTKNMLKVFNEDYVREKIGFEKGDAKGLSTIVLLGEQKEIEDKIKVRQEEKDKILKAIDVYGAIKTKLADITCPESPDAIRKGILTQLMNPKTGEGWSYRDKRIRVLGKALPINKDIFQKIISSTDDGSQDINLETLEQKIEDLEKLRSQRGLLLPRIRVGTSLDFAEQSLLDLLNKKIEKPDLNDRDKRIVDIIAKLGVNWITEAKKHLDAENIDCCPCCQRPLAAEEKKDILKSIEAALSKDVHDYQEELRQFSIPTIPDFDQELRSYSSIARQTAHAAQRLIYNLRTICASYQKDIAQRMDNVYGMAPYISHNFKDIKEQLLTKLAELEELRVAHENIQQRIHESELSLQELNFKLAKREISDDYERYLTQRKTQRDNDAALAAEQGKLAACQKLLDELEAQKKDVKIAADRINAALKYIYLSDKRIQLEANDGVYKIKSNGNDVAPRDVSVGERNALALCYFFSDMFEGSDAKTAYRNERLIVLDDPVSSFDHENKMGVLSYIMFELENLTATIKIDEDHEFRPETRIICLMHELYSFLALASSINSHDKQVPDKLKMGHVLFALNNKKKTLDDKFGNIESINEYRKNFQEVFDYAKEDKPTENIHIGNQARRLLEAFATFVYRDGIEHLFYADVIPGSDDDAKKYRTHFKSVFSRFVVNDESHLQGRIRSLGDANNLMPFVDEGERQKAVRDAICLLYLILPQHILALFRERKPEETKKATDAALAHINSWLKEIRDKTALVTGEVA